MHRIARPIVVAAFLALPATTPVRADPLAAGSRAFARGDYASAARQLLPIAECGNARAQAMLGFMFATGQGVSQDYFAATGWYRLSAERGDTTAQYLLGLMYDKGQGVPQNQIAAYKWLNLAAARAPRPVRENYQRLRDAVASKMTRGQIAEGQRLALQWATGLRF